MEFIWKKDYLQRFLIIEIKIVLQNILNQFILI